MKKAIALFSGGLDSMLAVKVIAGQGIKVEGVTFETPFFGAERAKAAAEQIGLELAIVDFTEEHLRMLENPQYGYGRNMNPCIDCHALMLNFAGKRMEATCAQFIFTGEVLGQRPMSQNKQSLQIVAQKSGYTGFILRPLSAKLLSETKPEMEGIVDRGRLLDIQGRGRKKQMELAKEFGIDSYPTPAGGCLLTDPVFSKRLRDLFSQGDYVLRDIHLLKYGRHIRVGSRKIIIGRNKSENKKLADLCGPEDIVINVQDHPGPVVVIPYGAGEETMRLGAAACARYSDAPQDKPAAVKCAKGGRTFLIEIMPALKEEIEKLLL